MYFNHFVICARNVVIFFMKHKSNNYRQFNTYKKSFQRSCVVSRMKYFLGFFFIPGYLSQIYGYLSGLANLFVWFPGNCKMFILTTGFNRLLCSCCKLCGNDGKAEQIRTQKNRLKPVFINILFLLLEGQLNTSYRIPAGSKVIYIIRSVSSFNIR